jgi:hypothetical protein
MFKKRQKKIFPPGTFIATPARIAAIIHLCLAFSLFLWIASQPFMGDLFAVKSELVLYEAVVEKQDLMEKLSTDDNLLVSKQYEILKDKLQIPFSAKSMMMLRLLIVQTPPWEQAWLFFSFIIPLLLLLRIEGAVQVCWLLPVITLGFCLNNQINMLQLQNRSEYGLFPTEEYIVQRYLGGSLEGNILGQQNELNKGWENYLITEWAHESPADVMQVRDNQVVKGEFAFNIARIKARQNEKILAVDQVPQRQSLLVLFIYLMWNFFFAFMAQKANKKSAFIHAC